jgi:hypothetical protein
VQQRTDASKALDVNAKKGEDVAKLNADKLALEIAKIKDQTAESRRDAESWRWIQLIVAAAAFIPLALALVKLADAAGMRRGEHSAAKDKVDFLEAQTKYAIAVAGSAESKAAAQETKISQIAEAIGLAPAPLTPAPPPVDPPPLKFTVDVPQEHHQRLAEALSKLENVIIDTDALSGKSLNSDGSKLEFAVLNATTIGVTVTANPNHLSLDQLSAKVVNRITTLLSEDTKTVLPS